MLKHMNEGPVLSAIKEVMKTHDPETLLRLGAPQDEYDPESKEIMRAIKREGPVTPRDLAYIVRLVLHYHFHSWSHERMAPLSTCMPLAQDLWKALPNAVTRS